MSFKEAAEKNSALFVLGLLLAGFLAGIGVHKALTDMIGEKTSSASEQEFVVAQTKSRQLAAQLAEAQERASGLTAANEDLKRQLSAIRSGNEVSTAALSSSDSGDLPKPGQLGKSQTVKNFDFSLQDCRREGADINCWLIVTNRDVDQKLWVRHETRMIDDSGEQHMQSARLFGGSEISWGILEMALAKDVPTRLGLRFKGVFGKNSTNRPA